jgi:3-deoxy-manno-octulosonate cytidylyltransferase (CMP-KDO synthetase)
MKKAVAIIPARYASTRFPGKPLVKISGKTMIERVYTQAMNCPSVSGVYVATDHEEIQKAVLAFGGKVVMTSPDCRSGTDRCAEVVLHRALEEEIVVNVQGDEPFIQPEQIAELVSLMQSDSVQIGTLARKITESSAIFNPNVVKVVRSKAGKALYFSRNPIPFVQGSEPSEWFSKAGYLHHIGLYAYRKDILSQLAQLPPGVLEQAESLEQLRWLEAGFDIYVAESSRESMGIDTPEDLEGAEKILQALDRRD